MAVVFSVVRSPAACAACAACAGRRARGGCALPRRGGESGRARQTRRGWRAPARPPPTGVLALGLGDNLRGPVPARESLLAPSGASELTMTTGIGWCSIRRSRNSVPSIRGISMSSGWTSGRGFRDAIARDVRVDGQADHLEIWLARKTRSQSTRRTTAESSTTRIRMVTRTAFRSRRRRATPRCRGRAAWSGTTSRRWPSAPR